LQFFVALINLTAPLCCVDTVCSEAWSYTPLWCDVGVHALVTLPSSVVVSGQKPLTFCS